MQLLRQILDTLLRVYLNFALFMFLFGLLAGAWLTLSGNDPSELFSQLLSQKE